MVTFCPGLLMCKYLLRSSVFWCEFSLTKQIPHGLEMSSEERTHSLLCPEFDELGESCSLVFVECSQCCWHLVAGTCCCFVSAAFGALLCHFSFSHVYWFHRGRERGRGELETSTMRESSIGCLLHAPYLGPSPQPRACALTGNWTVTSWFIGQGSDTEPRWPDRHFVIFLEAGLRLVTSVALICPCLALPPLVYVTDSMILFLMSN